MKTEREVRIEDIIPANPRKTCSKRRPITMDGQRDVAEAIVSKVKLFPDPRSRFEGLGVMRGHR